LQTTARLLQPPPRLSGCLLAAFYRDTREADLSDEDRINYFPASPLVAVTRILCGELRLFPPTGDWREAAASLPMPVLSATGPKDTPIASWSAGEVTACTVSFYYDAWLKLGGRADFSDIPASIATAMEAFDPETKPERGWDGFCDALAPAWQRARPTSWPGLSGVGDWARAALARAAFSNVGRSLRSIERRTKRATGQTRRSLEFYDAFENLHRIVVSHPDSSPAEIAQQAGYADQSHMGRYVRRATGFSPARLNRAIKTQEAFWCYRLLGERF